MEQIEKAAEEEERNNGMADAYDIKFEEDLNKEIPKLMGQSAAGSSNVHYMDWFYKPKIDFAAKKGRNDDEKEEMLGKSNKKRDVIGNALRAGNAAKKYTNLSTNRRLSENAVLEKSPGMEDGMPQSSTTIWCHPPTISDLPTPQGQMLINLGGRLRAMMAPSNHQSKGGMRGELLGTEFGQVRNCKSYTDVSEENRKAVKLSGKNANSAEKLIWQENNKRESISSQDKDKTNQGGNESLVFHNIAGVQNSVASKSSASSIGFKLFRMRTKSEVNKRETIYKNDE